MHLIEIVIDGFKSYSVRTSVENLDPQFNAITGLNGSGKSNILDAICFVMGISRMAQIRVEKMQELVYKGGNSSVSKASVTLKFENKDKAVGPPNYTDCEQISVTRTIENNKVKCFINGKTETQERVRDLFASVKLNINNPHFLIMQGRITKVINMKPKEFLELIEEASGVSQYQLKKEQALETIKKKELKIQETNSILENDVMPQFKALQTDKENFDQFNALVNQIEEKQKLKRAYDFNLYSKEISGQANQLNSLTQEFQTLERRIESEKNESVLLKAQLDDRMKQHTTAASESIDKEIQKTQKVISEVEANIQLNEKQLDQFNKLSTQTQQKVRELNVDKENLSLKVQKCKDKVLQMDRDLEKKKDEQRIAEQNLKKFESGTGDGQEQTNIIKQQREQLIVQIEETTQLIKQIQLSQNQNKQRLGQAQQALTKSTNESASSLNQEKQLTAKIQSLENETKLNVSVACQVQAMESEIYGLKQKIRQSQEDPNMANTKYFCDFQFNSPYQGFDRNQVCGRISTLFRVKNVEKFGVALSEICGNRLRNIVVEKQQAAKEILNAKQLKQREFFEPLDQIRCQRLSNDKVQEMKNRTDEHTHFALDLVECDPKYSKVMELIFGSTFVTESEETAIKISKFYTCVTTKGDSYKNNGTISGGFNKQGNRLQQIATYLNKEDAQRKQGQELDKKQKELETLKRQQDNQDAKHRELDSYQSQLKMLKLSLGSSSEAQMITQKENLKRLVSINEDLDEELTQAQNKFKEIKNEKSQLDKQIQNQGDPKEQKEFLKQRLQQSKDQKSAFEKEIQQMIEQQTMQEMKCEDFTKEIQTLESSLMREQVNVAELLKIKQQEKVKVNDLNKQLNELKMKSEKEQKLYNNQSAEIQTMQNTLQRKETNIEELCTEKDQKKIEIKNFEHRRKIAMEKLEQMKTEYPNLAMELHNTKLRFDQMDPNQIVQELEQLMGQRDDLKKRVNVNIELMFEKTQKWHQELLQKRETLGLNKANIESTIVELDKEKNKDLMKTVKEVDKNLHEIFSVLLPNVSAGLKQEFEGTVLTGLNLKVTFNGVEKESLTELSGGQRSLLALSLILALLKYQPAPLYILDEIDSALDLSHTQNIGIMIKKYFQASQFIIVSLKEGLFQNANVLYKIVFKDNRSTVTRLAIR